MLEEEIERNVQVEHDRVTGIPVSIACGPHLLVVAPVVEGYADAIDGGVVADIERLDVGRRAVVRRIVGAERQAAVVAELLGERKLPAAAHLPVCRPQAGGGRAVGDILLERRVVAGDVLIVGEVDGGARLHQRLFIPESPCGAAPLFHAVIVVALMGGLDDVGCERAVPAHGEAGSQREGVIVVGEDRAAVEGDVVRQAVA